MDKATGAGSATRGAEPADTMMALRAHARGGPEQLVYEQAPIPGPGPGEVLVAVHAAAITFTELGWDEAWTAPGGEARDVLIPSHEVSGTVAALGPGAAEFSIGDEVYGLVDFDRVGAAAEYVAVPVDALAPKPRAATHAQAAALALAALTAWQALADHAGLASGERVLIHGGAGGVGVYAVQIAAALGAEVIATGSAKRADFVRGLGAARYVSYDDEAFDQVLSGLDVVLDTVGGAVAERSYGVLRPGGRFVTVVAPSSPELADKHDVRADFFIVRPDGGQLARLASLVDAGRLRPVVAQTYPISDGRQAFEAAARPHDPGKFVLIVR
ncbi:MAG TPA: NADP-dependent oxidoreductase [Actinocrinis sp.]|nr:NADP-dependent oxidoreductase [Actinocrinis sp.]